MLTIKNLIDNFERTNSDCDDNVVYGSSQKMVNILENGEKTPCVSNQPQKNDQMSYTSGNQPGDTVINF